MTDSNSGGPSDDDLTQLHPRRLAVTELPAIQALAYGRDWHYPDATWRLLLDIGELHGIFDLRGDLVSVGALVRFRPGWSTIGMVITDQRVEGRGLGRRLMSRLLERAEQDVVTLYATAKGRPLYEKLDFEAVADNTIFSGRPNAVPDAPGVRATRSATPNDLPGIVELDLQAMGVDRSALVARLFDYADRLLVIEREGAIVGYAGAWRTSDRLIAGPVIAADPADAIALLDGIAASWRGPIRLEVSSERPALAEWATARELTEVATITIMSLHGRPVPGRRELWHVPFSVAVN